MSAGRGREALYVETFIRADMETVWRLTQTPELHTRWDLRFSRITPFADLDGGGYRFRYERSLVVHTIVGTGTSLGERDRPDGSRTSALRFTTEDRLSPLGEGRGYWRYIPTDGGIRFITGYDYAPGWGGALDRLVLRRFIGWMTAFSFDRLRLWAEDGVEPERWPMVSALQFWRAGRPRAARCVRTPHRGRPMDAAPRSLDTLESP